MTDTRQARAAAAAAAVNSGFSLAGLGVLGTMLRRGDIALAVGVMTILVVLSTP